MATSFEVYSCDRFLCIPLDYSVFLLVVYLKTWILIFRLSEVHLYIFWDMEHGLHVVIIVDLPSGVMLDNLCLTRLEYMFYPCFYQIVIQKSRNRG